MNCKKCTQQLDENWAFCPNCGQKAPLSDTASSSTPPPPSTPTQKLAALRSTLLTLSNSCNQDNPLRAQLAGVVAQVDEVIQGVEQLDTPGWRDDNSQLQLDMQRELERVRQTKPNDEKGPHHITMKRPTGF